MTAHEPAAGTAASPLRIRLLSVPGCPHVAPVRAQLAECLLETGLTAAVEEVEGPYPSPTLLVNGLDVTTGETFAAGPPACRLDLPDPALISAALRRAAGARDAGEAMSP